MSKMPNDITPGFLKQKKWKMHILILGKSIQKSLFYLRENANWLLVDQGFIVGLGRMIPYLDNFPLKERGS